MPQPSDQLRPGRGTQASGPGRQSHSGKVAALADAGPPEPGRLLSPEEAERVLVLVPPRQHAEPKRAARPVPAARLDPPWEQRPRIHCAKRSPSSTPEPGSTLPVAETAQLPSSGRLPPRRATEGVPLDPGAASSDGPFVLLPSIPPGLGETTVLPGSKSLPDYFDGLVKPGDGMPGVPPEAPTARCLSNIFDGPGADQGAPASQETPP